MGLWSLFLGILIGVFLHRVYGRISSELREETAIKALIITPLGLLIPLLMVPLQPCSRLYLLVGILAGLLLARLPSDLLILLASSLCLYASLIALSRLPMINTDILALLMFSLLAFLLTIYVTVKWKHGRQQSG